MIGRTLGHYELIEPRGHPRPLGPLTPARRRAVIGAGAALMLVCTLACALGNAGIEWMPDHPGRPNVSFRVDFTYEEAYLTSWEDADLDLRGWTIRCEARRFYFPEMTLEPRQTVTITNGVSGRHNPPSYLRWDSPNIWSFPSVSRPVELYDANGNRVAIYQ